MTKKGLNIVLKGLDKARFSTSEAPDWCLKTFHIGSLPPLKRDATELTQGRHQ